MAVLAPSDAELVQKWRAGHPRAFRRVVRRYQRLVLGVAFAATGDPAGAEDLAQETFVAAWRGIGDLDDPGRLGAWLAGIARNLARSAVRRNARRRTLEPPRDEAVAAPSVEDDAAVRETQNLVRAALAELPDAYRETLVLFYLEGRSVPEVARKLGTSEAAVKQRLSRGRRALRDNLATRLEQALDRLRPGKSFTAAILAAVSLSATREAAAAGAGGAAGKALVIGMTAKKTAVIAFAIALLVVLGFWLHGSGRNRGGDSAGQKDHDVTSALAAPAGNGGAPSKRIATLVPDWTRQPGAPQRRVAGRVIYEGKPFAGATVRLSTAAVEYGEAKPAIVKSGPDGRFDFGVRPAAAYTLTANAPGKAGAMATTDSRNPSVRPPADDLVLVLRGCGEKIVGTVRDSSGGVIEGAHIFDTRPPASRFMPWRLMRLGPGVTTDKDGHYAICVAARRSHLTYTADGYGSVVLPGGQGNGILRQDVSLVPEAVVAGIVVRADDGEPVAGARVTLVPLQWMEVAHGASAFVSAGQDGRFRIRGVAPGRYWTVAAAPGLFDDQQRVTVVSVKAGETREDLLLRLEPASRVSGIVKAGDEPMAGVTVVAQTTDPSPIAAPAVSQADGSFVLTAVPRGEIRFRAPPHRVLSPTSFQVTKSMQTGVVIHVDPLASISGRVLQGGDPVPYAKIQAYGPRFWTGTADAHGRYRLELPPSTYRVSASSDDTQAFGYADPKKIVLAAGDDKTVDIQLAYSASISGVLVDQHGNPVQGLEVQFVKGGDQGAGITGKDGSFRATMLTGGGDYRPVVMHPGQRINPLPPADGKRFAPVSVPKPDSHIRGVRLAVRIDNLHIAGRVVDSAGDPLPDVRVSAQPEVPGRKPAFARYLSLPGDITDENGRFQIRGLSAASFAVQAKRLTGTGTVARNVTAGTTNLVLTLPAAGRIEGSLRGFGDGVQVFATTPGDSRVGSVNGGTFVIGDLSPGSWVVQAESSSGASTKAVKVAGGVTSHVDLVAGDRGPLKGRVVTFRNGKPVPALLCRWAIPSGNTYAWGLHPPTTDADGRFVLKTVPRKSVEVLCVGNPSYSRGSTRVAAGATPDSVKVLVVQRHHEKLGGDGIVLARFDHPARVESVRADGPGARAGVEVGDRILAVNGADVTQLASFGVDLLIRDHPVGSHVVLTIERNGNRRTATVMLGR